MHDLSESYNLILNKLKGLSEKGNFYFKPVKSKLSDLELIALSIYAEMASTDSERQLLGI